MTRHARTGRQHGPASALGWSLFNTVASRLGTLGISIVLARLLGPEEFGKYAIALVALLAVLSFNELGVSLAIVRWPGDPRAIAGTVTTIAVIMSVVLTGLIWVTAGPFAAAMGDPSSTRIVQLMGLSVLVNGIVATPAALLQRSFRQDRRMMIDQLNVWGGAITSVVLAVSGMGAMSLVLGRLAGATVSGVLFLVMSPIRLRFGFDRRQIRPLLSFGLPLAGASMLVFAAGYVDQVVVGAVLGPVALGYYVLALNLSNWPVTLFSQPLRSVGPAMFARLQHKPVELRQSLTQVFRPLAAVIMPACVAIAAAAPQVVRFVYGDAWAPAADALRWLALAACARIFVELVYDYLVVIGRSHRLLVVQALWILAGLPAVAFGARLGGVAGAALAQLAVVLLVVLPAYWYLLGRERVAVSEILRRIAVPTIACVLLGGAAAGLSHAGFDRLPMLFLVAGLALGVVAALLAYCRGDVRALRALASEVRA